MSAAEKAKALPERLDIEHFPIGAASIELRHEIDRRYNAHDSLVANAARGILWREDMVAAAKAVVVCAAGMASTTADSETANEENGEFQLAVENLAAAARGGAR